MLKRVISAVFRYGKKKKAKDLPEVETIYRPAKSG